MKPAPFEFHAPTTLSEALALLVHRRRLAAVVVERALHGALGNVSGAAQGGDRSA